MGKPKGSKNKIHSGIYYPRKCEICDYMANNPSMFHYHKKTHLPTDGKLCGYGCGLPAKFVSTAGTFCCSRSHMQCPEVRKELPDKVAEQWTTQSSIQRRENTRETFIVSTHTTDAVAKAKRTKWAKWGMEYATEAQWKEFRKYARACRGLSQRWAKLHGYKLGQQTFHVDHIYSIRDGFMNKISPLIISHPANLRILEASKNSSKGPKSEMTLEELLIVTAN